MNEDFKLLLCVLGLFIVIPLTGMALSDWYRHDCRVELAKIGKSVDEIQGICK